jgi:MinD-like ATPase involved in chromosome partitioning or flagellar assembly
MRLGSRSPNEFIQLLNKKNEIIQNELLTKILELTKMINVKVMMGDSTITEQKTFDPKQVTNYLERISQKLTEWSLQDVSTTNNEDLRRIFTKFEINEGNYLISGHISLQFHVLLFYKPLQRVIDCQKELANIVDTTKNKETELSDNSDQFVLNKLKEMGYKDFDHQKLFEIFYEDEEFSKKVYAEIEKDAGEEFKKLTEKKNELFKELDSLLVETYQTSSVLIDDTRLVAGEEGCLCTLDIEFIKNNNREGLFDPRKMSNTVKENILKKLDNLEEIIKF